MTITHAVAIFYIFGLDANAILALVRVIVTLAIIVLTLRIPYKKNYVWMFLILEIALLWYSSCLVYIQNAPTPEAYYLRQTTLYTAANWVYTRVQVLLIFQFLVYFVSRKVNLWERLILAGGYAVAIVTVWVPLVIDPGFLVSPKGKITVDGVTGATGTSGPYLRPDGIDIYVTLMAIPIFLLLGWYYRTNKSLLARGQTKYLVVGLILYYLGFYALYLTQGTSLPNLSNLIAAGGDFVLLLGLRRKGFYSVTPTAETATIEGPTRYALEEGRSYLAHDQSAAFEGFSEAVRGGREGLLITRIFPAEVRKDYGIQTTPIRWLAESKGEDVIPPEDLVGISVTVKDFLQKAKSPIVMLQGLEYLTTYNGFPPILRLLNGLRETSAATSGILIVPVVPKSIDEKEEALLVAETIPFPAPASDGGRPRTS